MLSKPVSSHFNQCYLILGKLKLSSIPTIYHLVRMEASSANTHFTVFSSFYYYMHNVASEDHLM